MNFAKTGEKDSREEIEKMFNLFEDDSTSKISCRKGSLQEIICYLG